MKIILVGSPWNGFVVAGLLYQSDSEGAVGEWCRAEYGSSNDDFYELPLHAVDGFEPEGDYVVFTGDICGEFTFHGPFIEATAKAYADKIGGQAIELQVIDYSAVTDTAA